MAGSSNVRWVTINGRHVPIPIDPTKVQRRNTGFGPEHGPAYEIARDPAISAENAKVMAQFEASQHDPSTIVGQIEAAAKVDKVSSEHAHPRPARPPRTHSGMTGTGPHHF